MMQDPKGFVCSIPGHNLQRQQKVQRQIILIPGGDGSWERSPNYFRYHPAMVALNQTSLQPASFLLLGMAGLEDLHAWLSVPFYVMYLVALLGNFILLIVIANEQSLHEPMYLFLAMLAVAHLVLSSSTVPKTLSIFWSLSRELSFQA
ncbi:olfactory receptor 52b2-like [Limosa lapponica baueri]|uniref:Olfactory receptor 52b2-like n=1 Tax=Limosa lapponica baueri TaxID=1758121 RepID=A0A2I0T992_LIMLA|nr:olfactory receptor 52b2-like [Limosa lapponica baueri]